MTDLKERRFVIKLWNSDGWTLLRKAAIIDYVPSDPMELHNIAYFTKEVAQEYIDDCFKPFHIKCILQEVPWND